MPQIPHDGRRDEVALRDRARVERVGKVDGDLVVGAAVRRRVGEREPVDGRGVVDQALGAQEPRGQLALVPGGAHRDRDVDRRLARAGGADRERLLAAQPVVALLDRPAAVRRDADAGRLPLDRGRLRVGGSTVRGHAAIVPGRRHAARRAGSPPADTPPHDASARPRSRAARVRRRGASRDARHHGARRPPAARPDLPRPRPGRRRRRAAAAVHAARREAEARRGPAQPRAGAGPARPAAGDAPLRPLGRGLDEARLGPPLRDRGGAGARAARGRGARGGRRGAAREVPAVREPGDRRAARSSGSRSTGSSPGARSTASRRTSPPRPPRRGTCAASR